jgi:hypothetical protein
LRRAGFQGRFGRRGVCAPADRFEARRMKPFRSSLRRIQLGVPVAALVARELTLIINQ